jgi:hypothetical protein
MTFLSLKNYVSVPSKSNKQKKLEEKKVFSLVVGILKVIGEK